MFWLHLKLANIMLAFYDSIVHPILFKIGPCRTYRNLPFSAKMSDVLKCKQTTVIKMRTGGGGAETKISTDLKSGELMEKCIVLYRIKI